VDVDRQGLITIRIEHVLGERQDLGVATRPEQQIEISSTITVQSATAPSASSIDLGVPDPF
jgi:hypothetical protein